MTMTITEALNTEFLLFDGAMGTMLQNRGMKVGHQPEYLNLEQPQLVEDIHREYVAAGADIITTNTFQANGRKIPREDLEKVITAGVKLAKAASPRFVALNVGPIGQLLEPMGTLSFDEAYELFKEQVVIGEKAGADLVIIETFADLLEVKAAVLAIKENTSLPIFATLTYQEDGRTFVGCDPVSTTLTLQSLGVDALGVNCSLGPKELSPIVGKVLKFAKIPVILQANAGLPKMVNGQTVYDIEISEYVSLVESSVEKGVKIIGSCCGSTPEFTKALREMLSNQIFVKDNNAVTVTAVTSGSQTEILNNKLTLIGERLNPTGKKRMKEALRNQEFGYIIHEAILQRETGADILDVNVGLPEIDEPEMMKKVIQEIQSVIPLPLQIDSVNLEAIEKGARYYNGRPLINSVNGKEESMATVLPIVKKYGGLVLGLALDEKGIPDTAEKRFEVAKRIVDRAESYGIPREDVLIDPLVLTASAQQDQVFVTLDTIKLLKARLGIHTVVGLSNVSFGLPNRDLINQTFLAAAVGVGLDAPILNTLSPTMMATVQALKVIKNQDSESREYIDAQNQRVEFVEVRKTDVMKTSKNQKEDDNGLEAIIKQGRKDEAIGKTLELLETLKPLEIVNGSFIPALNEVGKQFETGKLFLPQLIQSAETVKLAQGVLKDYYDSQGLSTEKKGRIILATVKGDIHDIGKNIVKMLLENYDYDVLDLGKDVPIQKVVDTIRQENIKLVGLSALMTTTVANMKETITAVKEAGLDCHFMVGGAVLNEEYRELVGADYYAKDALESVTVAEAFFSKK